MKAKARTFLFVPALRLDRIGKALSSEADAVVIDLEDAVSAIEKQKARNILADLKLYKSTLLRINDANSEWFEEDVSLVKNCEWVKGVVLPKVESATQVEGLRSRLKSDLPIFAIIESARGILSASEIATSGVMRLFFGSVDYTSDLGAEPAESLFSYPRSVLVLVSAAAQLAPPIDGPTTIFDNSERLAQECKAARVLGMGGKICIHPKQLSVANAIFDYSSLDRKWAEKVLDAYEKSTDGVFVVDGEMVDFPVIQRARKILGSEITAT